MCISRDFDFLLLFSRSSLGNRSVVIYLLSSVALFRATLFAGVPYVPSVAKILRRVVAFGGFKILQRVAGVSLCQILLQVVIVFHHQFLYQVGRVFR